MRNVKDLFFSRSTDFWGNSERKSYPGDSCVENQTATSLQDQHGINVLKNNKAENGEMVTENTFLIDGQ